MINQIAQLGILAVLTKTAYTLGEVFSPKVKVSPPVKPEEEGKLEKLVAKLEGSEKKHEAEMARQFTAERIEQIKKKELRRYKAAQDKKWSSWLAATAAMKASYGALPFGPRTKEAYNAGMDEFMGNTSK